MATTSATGGQITGAAKRALLLVADQREREIIAQRYGLDGPRQTLGGLGSSFHLTRERIRQIEKHALNDMRMALNRTGDEGFDQAVASITTALLEMGRSARLDTITTKLYGIDDMRARGAVALIADLATNMVGMPGNARYYSAIVLSSTMDKSDVRAEIDKLVATLQKHGRPVSFAELSKLTHHSVPSEQVAALASLSKNIVQRDGQWGLGQWSIVNPHNIRDMAYIVLSHAGQPMHFSAIAEAINGGSFRTIHSSEKVIHNGLIKDPRFVLIGRGTYALAEWGYEQGTLTDVITRVLRKESPLTSDEIVRRVLQVRQLSDRTIRLSLHSQPQFKRVAKAEYVLDEKTLVSR